MYHEEGSAFRAQMVLAIVQQQLVIKSESFAPSSKAGRHIFAQNMAMNIRQNCQSCANGSYSRERITWVKTLRARISHNKAKDPINLGPK